MNFAHTFSSSLPSWSVQSDINIHLLFKNKNLRSSKQWFM